jgi:bacterioferritin (cytochrome b1)
VEICLPVHQLVIQPSDAQALALAEERFAENEIRPAQELIARLLRLDPAPLMTPRVPERRIIGTCRHFAVLACALLRHRGIESRVRNTAGTVAG